MDRFIVREPRTGTDYPQGNQMIAFPARDGGNNMIPPETIYFSGPFASEFPNVQHSIGDQSNIGAQHNMGSTQNTGLQHAMSVSQNMRIQHNMSANQNMGVQQNINAQHKVGAMGVQFNMGAHENVSSLRILNRQQNTGAQQSLGTHHAMDLQMGQNFGQNVMSGQGVASGIDPGYLAGYTDNSAQYIIAGQHIQRNAAPISCSFGSDYQNRSFNGIDRNKQKIFPPQQISNDSSRPALPKPQPQSARSNNTENTKNYATPQPKKPNELDLLRNDIQNQIMTRADKLKALYKSGPRAFSGPVEKVLKWHKSLQEIGVLIFYEIVAKCVSVRPGECGSKVLVVRDDSGPAMQVVYFEIDFLLPELKPPCPVRVIGRMMAGTCRLQAFNVRVATGDDVATLPRRAAVAAHHVTKLCKEYGPNAV